MCAGSQHRYPRASHGEQAQLAGPSASQSRLASGKGHESGHLSHYRSKLCLLAMRPMFQKLQKPNSTSGSVGLPAGCCSCLSLLYLPLVAESSQLKCTPDSIKWDLMLTLRWPSEVFPAGPPATPVSLTDPHHSQCPAPSMASPLACFMATEPVTFYAMLLL